MRVLVLGANGFVGKRILNALTQAPDFTAVAGVRRTVAGEHIVLDACKADNLRSALQNVEAVVNCVTGDAQAITTNAAALLAAVNGTGKRIVHMSSMAVYGNATGVVDESAATRSGSGWYADAKIEAEKQLAECQSPVTVFRPGIIYGAGSSQWTNRIATLLEERRIGDMGAAGDGCCNLVHVQDVAQATLAALRRNDSGHATYNLAMPDAPDWNQYFFLMAKAMGAVPIRRITARKLKIETKLLAIPLKLSEKVSRNLPPAITPSLAHAWQQNLRLDSHRATQELSISWMSVSDGVSEGVAGWKNRRV